MRQFYTLPRTKKASKSYFGIFVTFAWHTLLKLSHNTIKVSEITGGGGEIHGTPANPGLDSPANVNKALFEIWRLGGKRSEKSK